MKTVFHVILARRYWLAAGLIVLALLLVVADMPVDAAPPSAPENQTVPLPTATSAPAPGPTATPSDDDDDNGDEGDGDENDEDPAEPEPTPEPAPPAEGGGGAVDVIDGQADVIDGSIIGEVVVTRLNVRQEPNGDSELVGQLSSGDQVVLLGRNEAGDWWVVCCAGEAGQPGWVSAQFIQPNIRRVDANDALAVTANLEALLTAGNGAAAVSDAGENILDEADSAMAPLRLVIEQDPAYVRQGGEVVLRITVINDGEVEAQNVTVTNELPAEFSFESASVQNDGDSQRVTGSNGADIIQIEWLAIGPGEAAVADLTLSLMSGVENGVVIDNLAAVRADNAEESSGGVSIGTAPSLLPDF